VRRKIGDIQTEMCGKAVGDIQTEMCGKADLGSRCSDDHEGNRVSVRPDRTLKSSEEHRERCRIILVE
jgi:hypothetical protein